LKPPPFEYHRAGTREEVTALLRDHGDEGKILAGGQSLVPMLNFRLSHPGHLIDLNHLDGEPSEPRLDGGTVVFGPLVRQVAAERSDVVREHVPLLQLALRHVAHPAIRTRGTVVGSIAHADPAAEMPAVLVALGGEVVARSHAGSRTIAASDFFAGPLMNSLQPDEWVTEVRFPAARAGESFAFEEFSRRSGDYALCGVAAAARGGTITLAYLGVGVTPVVLELSSAAADEGALRAEIEDAVRRELSPYDDIHATGAYKSFLAVNLGLSAARRALGDAA
jgi:carbon-monoxide dehydrogenase medium subunit